MLRHTRIMDQLQATHTTTTHTIPTQQQATTIQHTTHIRHIVPLLLITIEQLVDIAQVTDGDFITVQVVFADTTVTVN